MNATALTYRPVKTLLPATYTFSAKEKDSETGLRVTSLRSVSSSSLSQAQTSLTWHLLIRRFGSRYYSSDLSIWLSVDPQAAKYPSLSPYVYCANNPIKLVDPNGEAYGIPPWLIVKGVARVIEKYSSNSDIRTAAYAINHPINAFRTGSVSDGRNNLSTAASNFAINMDKAVNFKGGNEGGERNAVRHALWQAILTNEFGAEHAERIGNAHENNSNIDLTQRFFTGKDALSNADNVVDMLNNQIGREIGKKNKGASNVDLAKTVIDEFQKNGLWTAKRNTDGSVTINKTTISAERAKIATDAIKNKNNYGLD